MQPRPSANPIAGAQGTTVQLAEVAHLPAPAYLLCPALGDARVTRKLVNNMPSPVSLLMDSGGLEGAGEFAFLTDFLVM